MLRGRGAAFLSSIEQAVVTITPPSQTLGSETQTLSGVRLCLLQRLFTDACRDLQWATSSAALPAGAASLQAIAVDGTNFLSSVGNVT